MTDVKTNMVIYEADILGPVARRFDDKAEAIKRANDTAPSPPPVAAEGSGVA